ncbi:ATP-dependent nuclease [Neobacillus massiliamazoniensis]|uniref:AAA+ ATPase domain-containing protein n=1 Tax=Neobacillus massiliamazoniensis TaxID=1499688 RepID=A0A0U1NYX7_9BACI|nr:AAA family ATPase [Neobacillus massiliamazoniensis]CRK83022.1 hypothetical protein BN000_02977 [Neobacillus massiliamazoniensis]
MEVWIKNLIFSDNSEVAFQKNDITIIVGPNNSGKSTALKEIDYLSRNPMFSGNVIKKLTYIKEGTEESLLDFLERNSKKYYSSNPLPTYTGFGFSIYENTAKNLWNSDNGLGELGNITTKILTTEARLTAANPAPNIAITREPLTHPIHYLQIDDNIELEFSNYFKKAFGKDLVLNRNAGNEVPLHIGNRPIPKEGEDRVSLNYIKELELLPKLQEQGDGMRSFVGVLLNTLTSIHSILLIDEPEAFLHPPQARLLGKMITQDSQRHKQLFLSTHSSDFLRGVLDTNSKNVKILRIQRNDNLNQISLLNNEDLKEFMQDPLLRHSNILDGLFHSKVIICESDSDCRFYSSIFNSIYDDAQLTIPDVMFIHCGGKHRIPLIIKALKKLNVDISVITDFDVLNNINPLQIIVNNLGGDWNSVSSRWQVLKSRIEQIKPELETKHVKQKIYEILETTHEVVFPQRNVIEINNILRNTSAWSLAKKSGKSFIPAGDAFGAFNEINEYFKNIGLYIVEGGELESFVRSIGNHGPKWVNEVLSSKDLSNDPELEIAREFVKKVVNFNRYTKTSKTR